MSYLSFPENLVFVQGQAPVVGAAAAITSLPISLKNVQKLWAIVCVNTVGTSAAVACVPQTDTLVAFGSAAAFPATLHAVPIWSSQATATTDLWTKETDAVNFSTTADALHKMVVFEIDPSVIRTTATAATDEDCFRISLTAVAAGDYVSIIYVIQPRYASKSDARSYIAD
jgi:hypothetical protein